MKATHLKLTKSSNKALYNWHAGRGYAFFSEGGGSNIKMFDIGFRKVGDKYLLDMGNSKCIQLTPEQIAVIGNYAVEERAE